MTTIKTEPLDIGYPFRMAVARGLVPDYSSNSKFGLNEAVGVTESIIWDVGTAYNYLTSAVQLDVVSDNIEDTNTTGTGAHTIRLYGLDANYLEIEEDIALNGTNAVTTTKSFIRIYRAAVLTAGTAESALGVIDIMDGVNIMARITNGNNKTLMAMVTVPAGKNMVLFQGQASSGKGKSGVVSFYVKPFGGVFALEQKFLIYQNSYFYEFGAPLVIPEKSDVEVRAYNSEAGTIEVSAVFDYLLVNH